MEKGKKIVAENYDSENVAVSCWVRWDGMHPWV